MSVFLAVDLDAPSRGEAVTLVETLRQAQDRPLRQAQGRAKLAAKWLRPDKLHCTLVFLGHPSADQIAAWVPGIDALALRHHPFSLRLAGAGTFVTSRAPSVLWLGVGGDLEALGAIQRDAVSVLGGGSKEDRAFIPHVTLARSKVPGAFEALAGELAGFVSSSFSVRGLSLYESSSEVYRVMHSSPLRET